MLWPCPGQAWSLLWSQYCRRWWRHKPARCQILKVKRRWMPSKKSTLCLGLVRLVSTLHSWSIGLQNISLDWHHSVTSWHCSGQCSSLSWFVIISIGVIVPYIWIFIHHHHHQTIWSPVSLHLVSDCVIIAVVSCTSTHHPKLAPDHCCHHCDNVIV